ncbi:MAG TPA: Uma2 family endonuclease [Longimicrobiaceae bacterium]|jgi:Uma2 family endonuclease
MEASRSFAQRWTYAEFARLPDDGNRYEVIAGELHVTPAPRPLHQRTIARLGFLLESFTRENGLGWILPGPVDVLFAEGDFLEPDLVFVRRERLQVVTERGIEGAPDLVVEVASPSTARMDRGVKRERYARFGVPEYWVVDADARSVEVYRMLVDPTHPEVVRDVLTWSPVPGGPALRIDVQDTLKGFS